jgi:hypothetical protein
MPQSLAIEVAPFALKPNVTEEQLLVASERLEREFLQHQSGYLGRATSRLANGRWADIVLWRSEEHAMAILPLIPQNDACAAYFSCMQGADTSDPAHGVQLFRAVRSFGAFSST